MTDEQRYRNLVSAAVKQRGHFLSLMPGASEDVRRLIWLRLMGLVETWTIV